MAKETHAPDYTIANTPHCLIHCGPTGSSDTDDKRDLTINTSANCQVVYSKSGSKLEIIQGTSSEVCGLEIDPEKKDGVAKAIITENGDIILCAENGNIRMKAKNIYMETSDGDSGEGNIMAHANGLVSFVTGDEIRLAAGTVCARAEKGFAFVGDFKHTGKMVAGGAADTASIIAGFTAGQWSSIMATIAKTCK